MKSWILFPLIASALTLFSCGDKKGRGGGIVDNGYTEEDRVSTLTVLDLYQVMAYGDWTLENSEGKSLIRHEDKTLSFSVAIEICSGESESIKDAGLTITRCGPLLSQLTLAGETRVAVAHNERDEEIDTILRTFRKK